MSDNDDPRKGLALQETDWLLSGVKAGVIALVVEIGALLTMAWQHYGQALLGITVGIVFIIGSLCTMFYRLGQRHG